MSNTVTTPKGTVLPLVNLKGKPYLQVAHRIQWFNEAMEQKGLRFSLETEFLRLEQDLTIARATINVLDSDGRFIQRATGTKREDSKGFPDHMEKAETGAIGRALVLLGFGTQFALADLDEGERIVDSPVADTRKLAAVSAPVSKSEVEPQVAASSEAPKQEAPAAASSGKPTFRNRLAAKSAASSDGVAF